MEKFVTNLLDFIFIFRKWNFYRELGKPDLAYSSMNLHYLRIDYYDDFVTTMIRKLFSRFWQRKTPLCFSSSRSPGTKSKTPAELAFPDHHRIKLYESLFWKSFKELPHECKNVLLLHWKEKNNDEIGSALDMNPDNLNEEKNDCTRRFLEIVMNHQDYYQFEKLQQNDCNIDERSLPPY